MSVSPPSSVTKTSPCWCGFIVPASTLTSGSNFRRVTRRPRAWSSRPIDEEVIPFPRADATPPVTKMYLVTAASPALPASPCVPPVRPSPAARLHGAVHYPPVYTPAGAPGQGWPGRSPATPGQLGLQNAVEGGADQPHQFRRLHGALHNDAVPGLDGIAHLPVHGQPGVLRRRGQFDRPRVVAAEDDRPRVERVGADRSDDDDLQPRVKKRPARRERVGGRTGRRRDHQPGGGGTGPGVGVCPAG